MMQDRLHIPKNKKDKFLNKLIIRNTYLLYIKLFTNTL